MLIGQHDAKRLRESGFGDIRLRHYLTPEPLVIRDDKTRVSLGIIDNCELVVRKRYQQSHIHGETLVMDAAAFYAGLINSDLHQSLRFTSA